MQRRKSWEFILSNIDYNNVLRFLKHKNRVEPLVVAEYFVQTGVFRRDKNESENQFKLEYMDAVNILKILDTMVAEKLLRQENGKYLIA